MREFYANIANDDSYEVMVRGRAVSYHRDAINELFGIDVEDLSDYDHLILAPVVCVIPNVAQVYAYIAK